MSNRSAMHRQVAFPVPDNGTEVLWCEATSEGDYRVLNVPVFAFGVSVGSRVEASPWTGDVLRFDRVSQAAPGSTIRCYVAEGLAASRSYLDEMFPEAAARGLRVGPATFFDPDIVAIHLGNREQLPLAIGYFDDLVQKGTLRFWELSDPASADEVDSGSTEKEPWELVHPFPDSGKGH